MATIDSSLVREDIRKLCKVSNGIAKIVKSTFEGMEEDPGRFDTLDDVSDVVAAAYDNVTLRKAYVRSGRHDYRIVFAHWEFGDPAVDDHVDVLLVFPRKDGWEIDWNWIATVLDEP